MSCVSRIHNFEYVTIEASCPKWESILSPLPLNWDVGWTGPGLPLVHSAVGEQANEEEHDDDAGRATGDGGNRRTFTIACYGSCGDRRNNHAHSAIQ